MPILVVENREEIRELLRARLSEDGYRVITARDGLEALAMATSEHPGLLILDMWLPRMSGWELAAALRRRAKRVPTIVMTPSGDAESCADSIGAEGYIAQPFDYSQLLGEVRRLAADLSPAAS